MGVDSTARAILNCVCTYFEEKERPVCQCYAVVGSPVVGPGQCCECEKNVTGVAIAQVTQLYEADAATLVQITPVHPCRYSAKAMDMTIWITRCYPTLQEDGLFDITEIDEAATEVYRDMELLLNALTCCGSARLKVNRVAIDSDPEGGCSTIVAQITAEVPKAVVGVGS